ncbi:VOC family protein [Parapedobacter sp. DT-150]|uniref:VOC family protein n=1 Tax=Parapedobacter sp. DT-150 TaxID=3396162 RepID=UPI003F1CC42C
MAKTVPPSVICNSVNPGFTVPDIPEAILFYTEKLGFTLEFEWGAPPHFASVSLDGVAIHLMKQENNAGGCSAYFAVEDADELYEFHKNNGVAVTEPVADRPYDMRDYQIQDPYGNYLGFGHYIMPTTPAIKIERVDVPVRLEKRLTSLLHDLAEHKGMSLDSTLEEIILHSFEPYGDGVASPHRKTTLRHIQQLKDKHGIDYDVHASYRFVE